MAAPTKASELYAGMITLIELMVCFMPLVGTVPFGPKSEIQDACSPSVYDSIHNLIIAPSIQTRRKMSVSRVAGPLDGIVWIMRSVTSLAVEDYIRNYCSHLSLTFQVRLPS